MSILHSRIITGRIVIGPGIAGFNSRYTQKFEPALFVVSECKRRYIQQVVEAASYHFYLTVIYFRRQIAQSRSQTRPMNRSEPFAYKSIGCHSHAILSSARQQTVRSQPGREKEVFIEFITFKPLIGRAFLQHIFQCTIILCP